MAALAGSRSSSYYFGTCEAGGFRGSRAAAPLKPLHFTLPSLTDSSYFPQFLHPIVPTACSAPRGGTLRPRTAVIITAAPEHAADVKSQPARSPTPRVAANTATAVQKVWQAKQLMK